MKFYQKTNICKIFTKLQRLVQLRTRKQNQSYFFRLRSQEQKVLTFKDIFFKTKYQLKKVRKFKMIPLLNLSNIHFSTQNSFIKKA